MRIRASHAEDVAGLEALLAGMSVESRWLRFFTAGANVARAAAMMAALEPEDGRGLIAVTGPDERVVAHATYVREPASDRAEVAFEVADEMHGRGIATIMLGHLATLAEADGVATFTATVLPENRRMIGVFRDSGFDVELRSAPGELQVAFPAALGESARLTFEERDRAAAAAAVAHVLRPTSIAVVGASTRPGSVGAAVLSNLRRGGFRGPVHLVHPRAVTVAGLPSRSDVPGVDLAIVAIPAAAVVDAARGCAAAGVRALVVLSAGFAEVGPEGAALQAQLLSVCRTAGMRLVGPNCLGVSSTAQDVAMNATFTPKPPPPGRLAFASQSGAYGITAIAEAQRHGVGLSSFVSMGNKADLSGNDFLQFWEGDEGTDVIGLYLESFGNPRRFGRIARRVAGRKPILAVKSGRSAVGARAASSHTGALVAASDATVDALFHHAGVIRVATVAELFDVASVLAGHALPGGDRVAIVTNAGGPGIACADACAAAGLRVPLLDARTRTALGRRLPPEAGTANPVDMIAGAGEDDYRTTIELLAADDGIDAIVAIFVPPLMTRAEDVARGMRAAAGRCRAAGTPLLAVWMAQDDAERSRLAAGEPAIPAFGAPEEAVRALAHAVRHSAWRRRAHEPAPVIDGVDADAVAATLAEGLRAGDGWLAPAAVADVLRGYGIPQVRARSAASATGAGRIARELRTAVAVKAIAPGLVHKSDAGAVRLGVRGAAAATRAANEIAELARAAGHEPTGFLVQEMAAEGVELLAGVATDPDFGPVVACAAGGRAVELLGDVQTRLAPVTADDAAEMIRALRSFPLLDGFRGAPRADVRAVEDVLVRLSALAGAHPEVAEVDCNPLIVGPAGAIVVDARVRVASAPAARPFPSLDR